MWGDELNAFAIDAASHSLKQLFHYLHYEAHPSLWYLLLYPITRWTAAPVAMKCLEGVIGATIYLFIALKSPFSRGEKLLLYLSYFVSFEYTVFSRMYGVLFLLALIYAQQRATHPDRVITNALLLGLMANTDTMGILLGAAFALEYLLNRLSPTADGLPRSSPRRLLAGLGIYLASIACSIATLKPAKDLSRINSGYRFEHAGSLSHLGHAIISYLVLPWFPIASGFPQQFWNPNPKSHPILYTLALPVIVAMLVYLFRRDRTLLILLGAMALIGITFGHLIYMGWERHYGILFTAFLVALWIQRYRRPGVPALAYVLLGLSAIGGVQAAVAEWTHPFSNSQTAADWVRAHHLENKPLISLYDMSIAEILQRPTYFLECDCTDTFLLFSDRRDHFDWSELPQALDHAMTAVGQRQALFIDMLPLTPAEVQEIQRRSMSVTPLLMLPPAEVAQEGNYLYLVTRTPTPVTTDAAQAASRPASIQLR